MKLKKLLIMLSFPALIGAMEQDEPVKRTEEEKKVSQPKPLFERNLQVVADQILNLLRQQAIIDDIIDEIEDEEDIQEGDDVAELKRETTQYIEPLFDRLRILAQTDKDRQNVETIIEQLQHYHADKIDKEAIARPLNRVISQLLKLPNDLRLALLETIIQRLPAYEAVGPEMQRPQFIILEDLFDELFENIKQTEKNKQITIQLAEEQKRDLANLIFKYENPDWPILRFLALGAVSEELAYENENRDNPEKELEKLRLFIPYAPEQSQFNALESIAHAISISSLTIDDPSYKDDYISGLLQAFELLLEEGISPFVSDPQGKSIVTSLHEWKNLETFDGYGRYKESIQKMLDIIDKVYDKKQEQLLELLPDYLP